MNLNPEPLFNKTVIEKLCSKIKLTDLQKQSALTWIKKIDNNELTDEQTRQNLYEKFILIQILGYDLEELPRENLEIDYTMEIPGFQKSMCMEVKGTKTKDLFKDQKRKDDSKFNPVIQLYTYMSHGFDYGVVTNYKDFILLTKNTQLVKAHNFNFLSIKKTEDRINENKLKEFILLFSKKEVFVNNSIEELSNKTVLSEQEFTDEFYKLFHETRLMLIKEFEESSNVPHDVAIYYSQIFLNRLIFIYFVEDHNFIPSSLFEKRILGILQSPSIDESTHLIFDDIMGLFKIMNIGSKVHGVNGFNGGLFGDDVIPSNIIFSDLRNTNFFSECYKNSNLKLKATTVDIAISGIYAEKLSPLIKNLLIMASHDFTSDLDVNILGRIFEQSISDIELLKENEISKRKRDGVFYTPDYITDYICRNTIIPYLSNTQKNTIHDLVDEYSENLEELETKLKNLKILDPACGSGAFLVKAVDILLKIDEEIQFRKPAQAVSQTGIDEFTKVKDINLIIQNNIYGVDINPESVEITKLSLFLKLAGPQSKLSYLSNNIKIGNSLISDTEISNSSFSWSDEFPEILGSLIDDKGFDIILGNPPYVSQKGTTTNPNIQYLEREYYRKTYHSLSSEVLSTRGGVKLNLFALWIERSIDLLRKNGVLGFIVHKNLLKVESYKFLRKFILENTSIKEVFDLGPKIFKNVTGETCIVQIDKITNVDNLVSAKENIDLEKNLVNTWNIPQKIFSQNPDYVFNIYRTKKFENLEKKLKSDSKRLEECYDVISFGLNVKDDKNNFKTKPENASWKQAVKGKNISKWSVGSYGYVFYDESVLTREGDVETFNQNEKLILQRIGTDLITAFDDEQLYCYNSTNMIRLKNPDYSLKYLLCLLNSKLINYYYVIAFSMKSKLTVNITQGYLSELPIKKIRDSKNKLESLANEIICLTKEKNLLQSNFHQIVSSDLEIKQWSNKLESFYELDFKDFISELKNKSTKKLSYSKQDEIQDYFNENKIKLLKIIQKIEKIDGEINEFVYNLYDISTEERNTIDQFKNERIFYS